MESFGFDAAVRPMNVAIYMALTILLLLVIVYYVTAGKSEHYVGVGLGHGGGYSGVTSGATLRTLSQEFSGTNQQDRQTLSTAEVAQIAPGLSSVGRPVDIWTPPAETLVSGRGEPDFWEIGNELSAYKQSQAAPMAADAAKKEMMYSPPFNRGRARETLVGSVGSFEDDALGSMLLR